MRLATVFAVVITMAVGFYGYSWQMDRLASAAGASSPSGIMDAVAVKNDLLVMANAQRQQFALEGRYASLDELRARGVPMPERRGAYVFSAEVSPTTFLITATYMAAEGETPLPPLTIGPSMQIE